MTKQELMRYADDVQEVIIFLLEVALSALVTLVLVLTAPLWVPVRWVYERWLNAKFKRRAIK